MMAGVLITGKARRRGNVAFDPLSEPNFDVEAWWDFSRATVVGGQITQVPDRGTRNRILTPAPGSLGFNYVASRSDLGHKPAGVLPYDGQLRTMQCTTLAPTAPFTIIIAGTQDLPIAGQTPDQVARQQYLFDYAGRQIALSFQSGPGYFLDFMLTNAGAQVQLGFKLVGKSYVYAQTFGPTNGLASACYASSPTPDNTDNFGGQSPSGTFYLGGIRSLNTAYTWAGSFGEVFIVRGALSKFTLTRAMLYAQSKFYIPISFDDPGSVFRKKYFFNTNGGQANADGFHFPMVTNVETIVAPSRAIIAKFAWGNTIDSPTRSTVDADVSQGSTFYSARVATGAHRFHAGGVDYETILQESYYGDSAGETRVERILVMGGGQPARYAFRDDVSLPFVELPFEPGTVIPDFAPTGTIDIGGDRAINAANPLNTYVRELETYTDGALPVGFTPPTYIPGALVWLGSNYAMMNGAGGWPAFTVQRLVAAGKNSYPRPRQVGSNTTAFTFAAMLANRATVIDPYYVAGGTNVVVLIEFEQGVSSGAAALYNDLSALAAALRASGWIVATCTYPAYGTSSTDTARLDFNSRIVAANPGNVLIDLASSATVSTLGTPRNPTNATAKAFAAIAAPVLLGVLP